MDRSRSVDADREESFLEAALDGTDQLVYAFDAEDRPRWWNDTVRELSGRTDAELTELSASSFLEGFVASEDRQRAEAALDRLWETGQLAVELDVSTDEGETVPYELRGSTAEFGDETAYLLIGYEITDRRERERKVEQLRRCTLELMGTTTRTESASIAAEASNEVIGAPLSGVFFPDETGETLTLAAAAHEVGDAFETEPRYERDAPDGTRSALVWGVFERGEPLVLDDAREADELAEDSPARNVILHPLGDHGVLIVSSPEAHAFDDTDEALVDVLAASLQASLDRVDREERLREQNERLDEFASILSHDLRNPLNVAAGHLELARDAADPEPNFDAIDRSLERIGALVEDLLTLAREEADSVDAQRVDLGELARSSWMSVPTNEAQLRVDLDGSVAADESRLRQLFENLFRNSVEHGSTGREERSSSGNRKPPASGDSRSSSGDSVEHGSTGSRAEPGDSVEHGSPDGDLVVTIDRLADGEGFYVADDGVGIPEDERDQVLSAGYSTVTGGTGLGLSIVEEVATAHGWSLSVTESAEGGARFEFRDVEWL